MKNHKKKIIIIAVVLLALILLCIPFIPMLMTLDYKEYLDQFRAWVESLGFGGVFILFFIQVLQIVVAIIPGEFVEILAGMIYGPLGGLVICLAGIVLSSTIIFFLVRRFGKNLTEKIYAKKDQKKYRFLFKTKNLYLIIFILFLIPGTPKDILTYICPLTKISFLPFMLISTLARIPSIISSTYGGANIVEGNFGFAAIIFVIIAVVGIGGILFHNHFVKTHANTKEV